MTMRNRAREKEKIFYFIWICCNPLKKPDSAKGIQRNPRLFPWIYLDLLGRRSEPAVLCLAIRAAAGLEAAGRPRPRPSACDRPPGEGGRAAGVGRNRPPPGRRGRGRRHKLAQGRTDARARPEHDGAAPLV